VDAAVIVIKTKGRAASETKTKNSPIKLTVPGKEKFEAQVKKKNVLNNGITTVKPL